MASRLISQLRKTLDINPGIRDLFEAPTVAQFAARLAHTAPARPALQAGPRPAQLPLSAAWRRLWRVDRIDGGKDTYSMPLTLTFSGKMNVAALATALDDVVLRRESLRTRFVMSTDGAVWQSVAGGDDARCTLTLSSVMPG